VQPAQPLPLALRVGGIAVLLVTVLVLVAYNNSPTATDAGMLSIGLIGFATAVALFSIGFVIDKATQKSSSIANSRARAKQQQPRTPALKAFDIRNGESICAACDVTALREIELGEEIYTCPKCGTRSRA
jgi:hypothetical protein